MESKIFALAGLSYLAGGIPTGYLVARKLRGIDIREHGSGNPGTANVYRVAGPWPGAITLLVDALKGYLPVLAAQRLYPGSFWIPMLCGALAVVGHDWTIFLGFKGGKGVATSGGVFAALVPRSLACAFLVFVAGTSGTGHISVGSMAGAAALPLACLALGDPPALAAMALISGLLILYKHIPNIQRLLGRRELLLREKKY